MKKFRKIVAIDPVGLVPSAIERLRLLADEVVMSGDVPADADETVRRIGDADGALLSYRASMPREVLERCPGLRYVGMCCSLYSPESANVDIRYAESRGIEVKGIRDYGDEGVVEYVVSELVRCLHGFGCRPWYGVPREITGLRVGMVGLGASGGMIADGLRFFGADIAYFARGEKPAAAAKGYRFMPLGDMLEQSDVVCCCLNRNTVLLHDDEFGRLGSRKILFNTGLSPAWDDAPFCRWIAEDNLCFCDTVGALGNPELAGHPHVRCMGVSTGMTSQAVERLSRKVIANIEVFLEEHE